MSTWGRKAGSLGKDQDLCLVLLARALLSSLLSRPYAAEKDDPRRSRQLQEGLLQKELRFFIEDSVKALGVWCQLCQIWNRDSQLLKIKSLVGHAVIQGKIE